jgi:hypothetical protein
MAQGVAVPLERVAQREVVEVLEVPRLSIAIQLFP